MISNLANRRGFTLIVTIALMVLLVMLGLGLLSLSTVTLRSTAANAPMQQARANARMALILALGQLQAHAGTDTAITATANLAGDDAGQWLAAGVAPQQANSINGVPKGLTALQSGSRYWTGVWRSRSANPREDLFRQTPDALWQQWLVSGNEHRIASNAILPSDTRFAVDAQGEVTDQRQAVVLVGENSVGAGPVAGVDAYVVAPKVELRDRSNGELSGRYAWWVGDEGVKSRINVQQENVAYENYRALPAQRRAWETVAGLESYPRADSAEHEQLVKLVTVKESELLFPNASAAWRANFHSTTSDSVGVLTDSLRGGLKIDLSAVFRQELPTQAPNDALDVDNFPRRGGLIIPPVAGLTDGLRAPRWDALASFLRGHQQLQGGALEVRVGDPDGGGTIAPLILDLRLLLGARLRMLPPPVAPNAQRYRVHPCAKIAIALANPYAVPLNWNQALELSLLTQQTTPQQAWPVRIKTHFGGGQVDDHPAFVMRNDPTLVPAFFPRASNEPAVFNRLRFRIPAGTLAPGAARTFTVADHTLRDPISTTQQDSVVNLVPIADADASNFDQCIEMTDAHLNYHARMFTFASQPSTGTTQNISVYSPAISPIDVRLALAGADSAPPLRFLRGVDLTVGNNWTSVNRGLSPAQVTGLTRPFPLILYGFSLSQPGVRYQEQMPASFVSGQRGGTMRSFCDFNLAAGQWMKPIDSYLAPPYFFLRSDSRAILDNSAAGGNTGTGFLRNLAFTPQRWGRSADSTSSERSILFTIPREVVSMAQWQHADLTGDDTGASVGHQPGNAFGNSYAPFLVKRDRTMESRSNRITRVTGTFTVSPSSASQRYYDLSYLLNAAVWDRYFLSTMQGSQGQMQPLLPMMRVKAGAPAAELSDPMRAAKHVLWEGAFNVNSCEKNAWKALLASSKHRTHPAAAASPHAIFPRSLEQISPFSLPPSGQQADSFSGFRALDDAQLDALAGAIVQQVRLRGPFLSLAHFVNRALAPFPSHAALTRSGALQSAIDESGMNIRLDGSRCAFSEIVPTEDRMNLSANASGQPLPDVTDQPGGVASMASDATMLTTHKNEQGFRSTGIPGWLTQADLLQVIGPSLAVRSDTFRIRAYGEACDASGNRVASAYCEAVVQRRVDYVDSSQPAEQRTNLSLINQRYGRQFHLLSFRWLQPSEI
jgi:type II secretory pathway pseudopilin PulG